MSLQFIHVRGILHFPDLRTSACTFVQFPPKLFLITSVTIFLSHFLFLCFCPYHYHPVQWLFMFFSCRKKHKLKETQPESSFSSEEFVRAYHSCLLWPLPRKWVVYIANVPFQASVIILGNSIIITWHIIISSRDNVLLRKTHIHEGARNKEVLARFTTNLTCQSQKQDEENKRPFAD